jgi:hypothetical protein
MEIVYAIHTAKLWLWETSGQVQRLLEQLRDLRGVRN